MSHDVARLHDAKPSEPIPELSTLVFGSLKSPFRDYQKHKSGLLFQRTFQHRKQKFHQLYFIYHPRVNAAAANPAPTTTHFSPFVVFRTPFDLDAPVTLRVLDVQSLLAVRG